MKEELKKFKKVELHLHLDGSVSLPILSKLSNQRIEEIEKDAIANDKCENLSEYLTKFDLPIRCMQTKDNLKTIEVANKYLNKGVCAIDLAGAEDKYPLDDYLDLFEIVKERNIPFTIHAGENGSYKEVEKAINIGAKRIGHGIHAIKSVNTQKLLKEKDILLEICPTSNVQTNSAKEYNIHPIKELYNSNIKICINTDNKTVSNISLTEEYIKLYEAFNFSLDDFKNMNTYAIEKAFLTNTEKEQLLNNL